MIIKVELDKSVERRFRNLAMKRYGHSNEAIRKATEAAIKAWTTEQQGAKISGRDETIDEPVALISGGLGHVRGKKTSVELQHEASETWERLADS